MSELPGLGGARVVLSVTQLVASLRGLVEESVGRVWVVGEVSNLRRAASGHLYFTLKDEAAQLRAVLFRGAAGRLPFEPEDGLELVAFGDVTLYEPRGDLQLLVRHLEPRGRGALQLAFEQLRARLEREGLFDPARKRPLPSHPRAVGIVTSPGAAALRDVIQVSGRRSPATPLLISPTRVQGEGAPPEIARALDRLSERPEVEVILLVRGGGSLEDLWAFNSEEVARAIVRARVPVVSGVGHEIDLTIADLAADARAPTPSAAAALALPDREAERVRLERDLRRLVSAARASWQRAAARFAQGRDALRMLAPRARLAAQRARLLAASHALERGARAAGERGRARLATAAGRLDSLSPLAVLGRGYAIVWREADGRVLRRAADAAPGEALRLRLGEGELRAVVQAPAGSPGEAKSPGNPPPSPRPPR